MNIAEYTIKKNVISYTLTLLIIVLGLLSYQRMGRLEDPDFTIKTAVIITQYPGATPEEVEEEVTELIESTLQKLGQYKEVRSISREGLSIVQFDVKDHYNSNELPQVWDELRNKIGDVQAYLPPGTGPSVVNDDFGDVYGIFMGLTGEGYTYRELQNYADDLRKELLLVKDVSDVTVFGERTEAVFVEISDSRIAGLGLSPNLVFGTLYQQNLVTASGSVEVGGTEVRINPTGEFQTVEEIGQILIKDPDTNTMFRLNEIAEIRRDYIDPPSTIFRVDGKPAIGFGVSVVGEGNIVDLGTAIDAKLAEIEPLRPLGMELSYIYNQPERVTESINNFIVNLVEALLIVIALLMVFMGLRSGILIGGILLLTVLGTFTVMYYQNIPLHRISLGALIIALGMLVDNAIVVSDGIMISIQRGVKPIQAAADSVKRTMWPLFGATVVAVLAFASISLSEDSTGEFLGTLFYVILISLFISWVLAITVTPLFAVKFLKVKKHKDNRDPYDTRFYHAYRHLLHFCIRNRWTTIIVMVALLVLAGYGFGFIGESFFPDSPVSMFPIDYWMPEGTDIYETENRVKEIESHVAGLDHVSKVTSVVGQGMPRFMLSYDPEMTNSSYAQVMVSVDEYDSIPEVMQSIRKYLKDNHPDAQTLVDRFAMGPGGGSVAVRFKGEDSDVLRSISAQVQTIMREDGGAKYIHDDWRGKVPVLRPVFMEAAARRSGISRPDLANALQREFDGYVVGLYREGDDLLPILTRPEKDEREKLESIHNVRIWSESAKASIPIAQVVSGFDTSWENSIIRRMDRRRTITVQCEHTSGIASDLFERLRPKIEAIDLPDGYSMEWGGEYESSGDAKEQIYANLPLAGLLMLITVIALFNALRQPIIIFSTIPLSLIGVTAGLLIMHVDFSFTCLLGFISLSGMLIKNAIVLLDQIEIERNEGKDLLEAIEHSSVSRVRPVMMAAMTTVLGMFPLLTDALFGSMSVTIMFGLTFATVLTLVIVPVMYAAFFRAPYVK